MTTERDLGRMAELKLEEWAAHQSISVNKAIVDKEGWDYLVQFPFSQPDTDKPLDRRLSRIECKIQVKGIETNRKRKSIKLSNWEKLVVSPYPAFFLVIEYGKENEPQAAYLIHVGEMWITKTLRRLRELRTVDVQQLHKKKMDLTWNEEDRIPSLDVRGLTKAIVRHIPEGMESYCQWKMAIREQVGDPVPALLRISTAFESEEELWTRWVDFIIGIREEMPVFNTVLEEDVRFDIPSKVSQLGEGTFKYKPNSLLEGSIVFRNDANIQRAVFKAQFLTPYGFFPNNPIPQKYIRERVLFEFGDVKIWPHTGEVNVKFNFKFIKKAQPLRVYTNFCRLLNVLQGSAQDGCMLEIRDKENRKLTSGGLVDIDISQLDPDLAEVGRVLEDVEFLSRHLGIPFEEIISTDQILSQIGTLRLLRQICDVNIPIDSFTSSITTDKLPNKDVAVTIARKIHLGELSYIIVTAVTGTPEFTSTNIPNSFTVQINNPCRIHFEHFTLQHDSNLPEEEVIDRLTIDLENNGFDVLIIP